MRQTTPSIVFSDNSASQIVVAGRVIEDFPLVKCGALTPKDSPIRNSKMFKCQTRPQRFPRPRVSAPGRAWTVRNEPTREPPTTKNEEEGREGIASRLSDPALQNV
jgi:hypothetical protein